MRLVPLPLLLGLACLEGVAQAPKIAQPPQVPSLQAASVPVTSYLLILRRMADHPRTIQLEIYTPDTRALHVDQLEPTTGKVTGSLDIAASGQPPDGRLARYEYRGDTKGARVTLALSLPGEVHLQIDRAMDATPATLSLLLKPGTQPGCPAGKLPLWVGTTGTGGAPDRQVCAATPVNLTWEDEGPVHVR